jgi:hypothetical protein
MTHPHDTPPTPDALAQVLTPEAKDTLSLATEFTVWKSPGGSYAIYVRKGPDENWFVEEGNWSYPRRWNAQDRGFFADKFTSYAGPLKAIEDAREIAKPYQTAYDRWKSADPKTRGYIFKWLNDAWKEWLSLREPRRKTAEATMTDAKELSGPSACA